jgi:hypothetical protein
LKNILTISAIVLFCSTTFGLLLIYPNAATDYNEFLSYYYAEQRLNEVLVSLLFLVLFIVANNRLLKSLSILGFSLAFSSMLDKLFFANYGYLYSDVIIIIVSIYLSLKTYLNGENPPRTQRPTSKNNNT